jgi:hypothetical protein
MFYQMAKLIIYLVLDNITWYCHVKTFRWWYLYAPPRRRVGGILIYPCLSVRQSGYRCMVCPANSSYSFRATALIFCRMFIHIMEVCMSTGFWWLGRDIICVLQTHFVFLKITPNKTTLSIIIKCGGILLF